MEENETTESELERHRAAIAEMHELLGIRGNVRPDKVLHFVKLLDAHHWEHHRLGDAYLELQRMNTRGAEPRMWEKRPEPQDSPYRHIEEVEATKPGAKKKTPEDATEGSSGGKDDERESRRGNDRMRRGGRNRQAE